MSIFLNRKIATKMITGFVLVALIAAVVGVIGIQNMHVIDEADTELYELNLVPIVYLGEMTQTFQEIRSYMYYAILAETPEAKAEALDRMIARRTVFSEAYEAFGAIPMTEDEQAKYNELTEARKDYADAYNQAMEFIEENRISEAIAIVGDDGAYGIALKAEQDIITEIVEMKTENAQAQAENNTETANSATTMMIIIIAAGVIVAILIGIFLSRIIATPIKKVTNAAQRLSLGDINVNVESTSKDEIGLLTNAFSEMVENIKEQAENAQRIAEGDLSIEIEEKSDKDVLALSMKKVVDSLRTLEEEQQQLIDAVVHGKLDHRGQTDKFNGAYKNIVSGINQLVGSLVNYFEIIPNPIQFMDKDLNFLYMNKTASSLLGKSKEELKGTMCADAWKTSKCLKADCPCARSMKENEVVLADNDCDIGGKHYDIYCTGAPIKDLQGNIVGSFEFVMDQSDVKQAQRVAQKVSDYQGKEVVKIREQLEKLSEGDLDISVQIENGDMDTQEARAALNEIADAVNKTAKQLKDIIKEISMVLSEMADKNLDIEIETQYLGEFVQLKDSINYIIESFNVTLGEINASAEQVGSGANQVASSSQDLSQGSSEQAGSVEEISASITQVAEQTKENAQNATKANDLSGKAKEDAQNGNAQMAEMLKAMNEIKESSKNISNIIKVIDEIAFQTNILALNAAVEAARAGEHGKGFAVVAEEVRNLAARSAKAAKETTELIDNSINKVDEGYKMANDTAEALGKIVTGVTNAEEIVGMIADASNEQANAIGEINQGIEQISQVTQSNTATAEESASASEEMSGQAQMLKELIQEFRLRDTGKKLSGNTINSKKIQGPRANGKADIKISLDDDSFGKY